MPQGEARGDGGGPGRFGGSPGRFRRGSGWALWENCQEEVGAGLRCPGVSWELAKSEEGSPGRRKSAWESQVTRKKFQGARNNPRDALRAERAKSP